jgi:hypothetical protein
MAGARAGKLLSVNKVLNEQDFFPLSFTTGSAEALVGDFE